MEHLEFITSIGPAMQKFGEEYSLPASIGIAQAMIESKLGESDKAINANNYFGRKKGKGWTGEVYVSPTKEYMKDISDAEGIAMGFKPLGDGWFEKALPFRKYQTVEEGMQDYFFVISTYDIYKPVRELLPDYSAYLSALAKKYATDYKYELSIKKRILEFGLQQYDLGIFTNTDIEI